MLFASHRAHQPRHVRAHAETLVADPVALTQILAAARTGERKGAHDQRESQLRRNRTHLEQTARQLGPGFAVDDQKGREHDEYHDRRDLQELHALEHHIDDRRERQRRADHDQHANGD